MRSSTSVLAAIAVVGCGRVAFDDDARRDGSLGGDSDAPADLMLDMAAPVDCDTAHPTAIFCDSFEEDNLGPWHYRIEQFATVGPTTTNPMRGNGSLESRTDGSSNTNEARFGVAPLAGVNTGDLYARAYYYLSPTTPLVEQLSLTVILNGVTPFPGVYVRVQVPNTVVLHIDTNEEYFPMVDPLPTGRWVCVELHVAIDGTNGFVEATFDGTRNVRSTSQRTTVMNGYTSLDVGLHFASPAQQALLWTDEVVLDSQPIGCD